MVPVLLVAVLTAVLGGAATPHQARAEGVCVVAHLDDDLVGADREVVRRIFLLRQRTWPDGTAAHPVNLPCSSPVRDVFSTEVLRASVRDLVPYWNERYFHGTRPPPSVASEAAVLLFLERTPGGVGYVSASSSANLPEALRTLFCTG